MKIRSIARKRSLVRKAQTSLGMSALAMFIMALGVGPNAWAQPRDAERTKGEQLFRHGKTLVDAQDFEAGCPKFEQSLAVLPSASTAIHVARCHEHFGRLATALELYERALLLNESTEGIKRRQAIEAIALKERDALASRVPAPPPPPTEPPPDTDPAPDAGPAPDTNPASPTAPAPETHTAPPQPASSPPASSADAAPTTSSEQAVWPWWVGGSGLALTGIGAAFLIDSRLAAASLDSCNTFQEDYTICPSEDYGTVSDIQDDVDRANDGLGIAIPMLAAGSVAIGASIVALLTDPEPPAPASSSLQLIPIAQSDAGMLILNGRY